MYLYLFMFSIYCINRILQGDTWLVISQKPVSKIVFDIEPKLTSLNGNVYTCVVATKNTVSDG